MNADYSEVDIFVEEAKHIDFHLPAMVVQFKGGKPRIRIIPSRRYKEVPDIRGYVATFVHETLHIWLWKTFGPEVSEKLDNLPFPITKEEFYSGVWGRR